MKTNMRPDANRIAAPASALTTVVDLSRVKRPADLPPSVARDLGALIENHVGTWSEVLRRELPKQLGWMALMFGAAIVAPGVLTASMAVGGSLGVLLGLFPRRRQAPYRAADDQLKNLGVGWLARRRILKKVRGLVGTMPARDPANRPSAGRIAAHLEPRGDEMGRQAALPDKVALAHIAELPADLARVVVEQSLTLQRRGYMGLAAATTALTALTLAGAEIGVASIAILMVASFAGLFVVLWIFVRNAARWQLRKLLKSLGLTTAQAEEGLDILVTAQKKLRRRLWRERRRLRGPAFAEALADAWSRALDAEATGASTQAGHDPPQLGAQRPAAGSTRTGADTA